MSGLFKAVALSGAVAALLASQAAALTLTTPANGAAIYMNHPGFFWESEAGAERYEIQVASNNSFTTLVDTDFIEAARYVPAAGLASGGDYYWRVRGISAAGLASPWSEVRSLTVMSRSGLPVYSITNGTSLYAVREAMFDATLNAPAIVAFATNGTYRFNPQDPAGYPWILQSVHAYITYWTKTGARSLRAQHAIVQSSAATQTLPLNPGTSYTFSGSIRFGAIAGGGLGARFKIRLLDGLGTQVAEVNTPYLKQSWGSWNDQTVVFNTSNNVSQAQVSCEVDQLSGDVAFDAVELRAGGAGANAVLDGSFESFDTASALFLKNATNVFVEGNGSTLIIEARANALRLEQCSSVQVSDFKVDYDPLQYAVASIDSVNVAGRTLDVTVLPNHPDLDHPMFDAAAHHILVVQDPAVPGKLKYNTYNGSYSLTRTKLAGDHQFRISNLLSGRMSDFAVGDRVVFNARQNGITGIGGSALSKVTFVNCQVLSSVAGTFQASQSTEINLLGCGAPMLPGRYYSSNADGMHFYDHRIGPWVENCLFEAQGDDAANFKVHGLWVLAQVATNQLELYRQNAAALIEVGDQLMIVDTDVVDSVVEATVTAVSVQSASVLVTVDRDVGAIQTGQDPGDTQVYNRSQATGNFVIRHSTFRLNRARGLSIQTDGLIADNLFEGISGHAIYIKNHLDWGIEGFVAPGTKVLRNSITECGFDRNTTSKPGGSIDIRVIKNSGAAAAYRGQKDVLLRGNTITDWNCAAISLNNGDGCEVAANVIGNSKLTSFIVSPNYPILVGNTVNSWVYDNVVTDGRDVPSHLLLPAGTSGIWQFAPGSVSLPASQPAGFTTFQEEDGWFYQYLNGSWQNMAWSTNGNWQGTAPWARIFSTRMHPHVGQDVAMVWQARDDRLIKIGGSVRKGDAGGGDGVQVKLLQNTTQLWPASGWQDIAWNDTNGVTVNVAASVTAGDKIYFVLNAKANQDNDSTEWQPTITEDFLAGWMAVQFTSNQLADPSISGYSANYDGDTLPTLLEFVMGTSPLQAEPSPIGLSPPAQFSFPRRKDLGDVTVTAQFSTNLIAWVNQPIPASVQDAGAFEMVTFAAPGGMQPSPALFFRVVATVNSN